MNILDINYNIPEDIQDFSEYNQNLKLFNDIITYDLLKELEDISMQIDTTPVFKKDSKKSQQKINIKFL